MCMFMRWDGRNYSWCGILCAMPQCRLFHRRVILYGTRNIRHNVIRAMPQMRFFAKQYPKYFEIQYYLYYLCNAMDEIFDISFVQSHEWDISRHNIVCATPQTIYFEIQYSLCNAMDEIFHDTISFVQRNILRYDILYAMQWTKYFTMQYRLYTPQTKYFEIQYFLCNAMDEIFDICNAMDKILDMISLCHKWDISRHNILCATPQTIYFEI